MLKSIVRDRDRGIWESLEWTQPDLAVPCKEKRGREGERAVPGTAARRPLLLTRWHLA